MFKLPIEVLVVSPVGPRINIKVDTEAENYAGFKYLLENAGLVLNSVNTGVGVDGHLATFTIETGKGGCVQNKNAGNIEPSKRHCRDNSLAILHEFLLSFGRPKNKRKGAKVTGCWLKWYTATGKVYLTRPRIDNIYEFDQKPKVMRRRVPTPVPVPTPATVTDVQKSPINERYAAYDLLEEAYLRQDQAGRTEMRALVLNMLRKNP